MTGPAIRTFADLVRAFERLLRDLGHASARQARREAAQEARISAVERALVEDLGVSHEALWGGERGKREVLP